MGLGYLRDKRPQGRLTLRRRALSALLALPIAAVPSAALAQETVAEGSTETQAAILAPGTITALADMRFGTIMRPVAAGTVILSPTGTGPTCLPTGGLVLGGGCQPAEFAIMGRKKWLVRINSLNGATILLTGPGGATMTVSSLTLSYTSLGVCTGPGNGNCNNGNGNGNGGANGSGAFGRFQINSDSGMASFRVGGTLSVAANQQAGVYNGTLNVEVIFN